jgi:LuxR family maltose regulon positive regulatory protein
MREGLTEVARLAKQAGNLFTAVNTLCILAELMRIQGRLHDAFEIYREAAGLAVDHPGRVLPIIANVYVGKARLHYEWNDFQAAEADILSASKIFKWYPAFDLMAESNILLSKLRIAQGDLIAAEQLIREIEQSGKQAYYQAKVALLASEIYLCTAKGDVRQLAQLIDQQDWSVADKSLSAWGDAFIAHAQVFIAQKEFDRAYQLLDEYRTKFETSGLWTHALKALVVQACTLELQGEFACAEDHMQHALSIAEPEGYIRIFLDAGVPAKSLVARCRSTIIERINSGKEVSARILAYVDRLLSMFPSMDNEKYLKPRRKEIPCTNLVDPLTERELEVLQLIADGFSNKEIAEKLVVTVGTVKTHTSNIYRKLDVLGRTKALAKARQLNLV